MFLDHCIAMNLLMIGELKEHAGIALTGELVYGYLILHGVYGVVVTIANYQRNKVAGGNLYLRQNKGFSVQFISGILLLVMAVFHVLTMEQFVKRPGICSSVILVLFVLMICIHMVISFPKAMISIGAVQKKWMLSLYKWIMAVLCCGVFMGSVYGVIHYYLRGGAV